MLLTELKFSIESKEEEKKKQTYLKWSNHDNLFYSHRGVLKVSTFQPNKEQKGF